MALTQRFDGAQLTRVNKVSGGGETTHGDIC
jgi:hypothetical protein